MADYKAIKGHNIQTVEGDPDPLQTGDIWYSGTTRKIRGANTLAAGAWASGGTNPKGCPGAIGIGIQTAAAMVGGGTHAPGVTADTMNATSLYDGSSWTAGNDLNLLRQYSGGAGTTGAGLIFAGSGGPSNPGLLSSSEEYDGTNWAEGGDLNATRNQAGGLGLQTAAMAVTGTVSPTTKVEEYDGSSWTEGTAVNTLRYLSNGSGTVTEALIGAGGAPGATDVNQVESWNGTSWTEVGDFNTFKKGYGMSRTPAATTLVFAGTPYAVNTESWDGSSWTEVANVSTGTQECVGAGNGDLALKFGGNDEGSPSYTTESEEWTKAVAATSFTSS